MFSGQLSNLDHNILKDKHNGQKLKTLCQRYDVYIIYTLFSLNFDEVTRVLTKTNPDSTLACLFSIKSFGQV